MLKLTLPAVLLLALACSPPARDYDVSAIQAVDDLETLMWVQSTVADDRFDLAEDLEGSELKDADRVEFEDMARRLKACGEKLRSFSEGRDDFLRHADKQALLADQLMAAATSGAVKPTREAVMAIQGNCATCHDQYR